MRNLGAIRTAYERAEVALGTFLNEMRILEGLAEQAKETLDDIGHAMLVEQAVNLQEKVQVIEALGVSLAHSVATELRIAVDRLGA